MKKLNKKGFTLVELLAVIVILALLMVVATRTIGNSLTSAKLNAMQTEAQKLFSKTYEEVKANVMLGNLDQTSTSYSYGTLNAAGNKLTGTDGDYSFKISIDTAGDGEVTGICITNGKNGFSTANASGNGSIVINGTSLTFGSNWGDLTTCS